MKKYLLTLALMAITAFSVTSLRADDTNAASTNAMAAASTNAAPAAAPAAPVPTNAPSMEQRLESIEAYFQNGDPTAPYHDTNGNWTVNFAGNASIINTSMTNSLGANVAYP